MAATSNKFYAPLACCSWGNVHPRRTHRDVTQVFDFRVSLWSLPSGRFLNTRRHALNSRVWTMIVMLGTFASVYEVYDYLKTQRADFTPCIPPSPLATTTLQAASSDTPCPNS